ncbi:MAG: hypothetical protein QM757_22115 [Paludibaculum sp.]
MQVQHRAGATQGFKSQQKAAAAPPATEPVRRRATALSRKRLAVTVRKTTSRKGSGVGPKSAFIP